MSRSFVVLSFGALVAACSGSSAPVTAGGPSGVDPPGPGADGGAGSDAGSVPPPPAPADDAGVASAAGPPPGDGGASPPLLPLHFCTVTTPADLPSAFDVTKGADFASFACKQTCADWKTCTFDAVTPAAQGGQPVLSKRGNLQMKGLAFVVDGMGGHMIFTPDGTDVVLSHSGAGDVDVMHVFDQNIQSQTGAKTVAVSWEVGYPQIFSPGLGWWTRQDAQPTSMRALVRRPASVLKWVSDNFAAGHKLGTVGSSMGTVATFGAKVWYGLDPAIDYQLLIGGPGMWDINAGCGRAHYAAGFCDVDAAPCTGNPNSSYGDDDPACPGGDPTNMCRVPTIMAFGTYAKLMNYVYVNQSCTPTAQDDRDPVLDESSVKFTVTSWSFKGPTEFIADEGAAQQAGAPADQGMGEGHMLYIHSQIQSAKAWVDVEGGHHGDSYSHVPALMSQAAARVIAGLGL